ncbi:MAG: transglutaminase domain-containing protein [Phycisphaerae bacterium]|nr:transglutaminase domain-containing protein [Phycisphaerae bacterium]
MSFRTLLVAVVVTVLGVAGVVRAGLSREGWSKVEEHWFEMSLAGAPCGYMQLLVEKDGDKIRTTTSSVMRLARDETAVAVETNTEFVENEKGEPISARSRQAMGGPAIVTNVTFERDGDGWAATVKSPVKTSRERLKGDWLTPQAIERFVKERTDAGAKEIVYRSLDVQQVVRIGTTTMKRTGEGTATIPEGVVAGQPAREVPVTIWTTMSDLIPLPTTEKHSADGLLVETVTEIGGIGQLATRLASEATAKKATKGGKVEVLVKSFVPAKVPIRGAREKDRLQLSVKSVKGDLPDLPSVGSQVVERVAPNELRVTVDVDRVSVATKEEVEDKGFREASALIDFESDAVRKLLAQVGPRAPDQKDRGRADQLRRFVQRYIDDKNLGTAFGSASETARTRGGDCSEHAVLLTALLRADGIPARVASGLIYADQFAGKKDVWGWHVWSQALIPQADGTYAWIDLDGTLPTRFDAAHLTTGVSDLEGGATDPMWTSTVGLLGNLTIDVITETSNSGEPQRGEPAVR